MFIDEAMDLIADPEPYYRDLYEQKRTFVRAYLEKTNSDVPDFIQTSDLYLAETTHLTKSPTNAQGYQEQVIAMLKYLERTLYPLIHIDISVIILCSFNEVDTARDSFQYKQLVRNELIMLVFVMSSWIGCVFIMERFTFCHVVNVSVKPCTAKM